jgi:hypothetical protein
MMPIVWDCGAMGGAKKFGSSTFNVELTDLAQFG